MNPSRFAPALITFGCIAIWSAPAEADDWQLVCTFDDAQFAAIVNYKAGDPSYDLTITLSGKSELGRGQRIELHPIYTPDELVFVGSGIADLSLVLRINPKALTAGIEIGSGVSWDYKHFSGKCKEAA